MLQLYNGRISTGSGPSQRRLCLEYEQELRETTFAQPLLGS